MGVYKWPWPQAARALTMFTDKAVDREALREFDGQWIAALMHVLGMSDDELAARLGVSQAAVARLRSAEKDGRITLRKMGDLAEELNATFVYALLPNTNFASRCEERVQQMVDQRRKHKRLKPKQRRRLPKRAVWDENG